MHVFFIFECVYIFFGFLGVVSDGEGENRRGKFPSQELNTFSVTWFGLEDKIKTCKK